MIMMPRWASKGKRGFVYSLLFSGGRGCWPPKRRHHNASVSSIDAACVHGVRIVVAHGFRKPHKGHL